MIILGIDPGTTTIGFALIKKENNRMELLDYGVFKTTPKIDLSKKILEIGGDISYIIQKYNPEILSVEKLFFQTNTKTAIDVAQARGVIVYEGMKNNLRVFDYTPLQVKKAITGNGKANKLQLQNAIKILFGLQEIPKPDDAADAIGLAYIGALNSKNLI